MPFCPKCGNPTRDDDSFCMKCGAQMIPFQMPQPETAEMSMPDQEIPVMPNQEPIAEPEADPAALANSKAEALEEMDRMITYYKPMQGKYEELKLLEEDSKNTHKNSNANISVNAPNGAKFKIIGGIMIGAAGWPGLYFLISSIVLVSTYIRRDGIHGSSGWYVVIIILWFILAGLGIFFLIKGKQKAQYYQSLLYEKQNQLRSMDQAAELEKKNRIVELRRELSEHHGKYDNSGIKLMDCDPVSLRKIRGLISSNKVNNVKDAVSLYYNQKDASARAKRTDAAPRTHSARNTAVAAGAASTTVTPAPAYTNKAPGSGSAKKPISLRSGWKNAEIYTLRYVDHQVIIDQIRTFQVLAHGVQCNSHGNTLYFSAPYWQAKLARIQENSLSCVYRFEFTNTRTRNGMPFDPAGMKSLYNSVGLMLVNIDPETTVKTEAVNYTHKSDLF